jgi:uncharacterized membrane protein YfcA
MTLGLLMLGGGLAAGVFGSLLGLGGGILIVPLLTLGFGLPLREAVGVSLVSVIVTSSAAAGVYLGRHVANLRLGMLLELFTATGAMLGGLIAFAIPDRVLAALFALLLAYVSFTMVRRADPEPAGDADGAVAADDAGGSRFMARLSGQDYRIHSMPAGIVGSVGAGVVSALLGIGGGLVKVPVMHLIMGVPLRVATATSNLMIGITASASAIIYLLHDGIAPNVAGPTAIGVFIGASAGSRLSHRVNMRFLRVLFVAVLLYTAFQMVRRALGMS